MVAAGAGETSGAFCASNIGAAGGVTFVVSRYGAFIGGGAFPGRFARLHRVEFLLKIVKLVLQFLDLLQFALKRLDLVLQVIGVGGRSVRLAKRRRPCENARRRREQSSFDFH